MPRRLLYVALLAAAVVAFTPAARDWPEGARIGAAVVLVNALVGWFARRYPSRVEALQRTFLRDESESADDHVWDGDAILVGLGTFVLAAAIGVEVAGYEALARTVAVAGAAVASVLVPLGWRRIWPMSG